MSFFNGYAAYATTNQSSTSPTRTSVWGSSYSPFRSTTLPIQDITMSQTLPCLNGTRARSPGKGSPTGNGLGSGVGCGGIVGTGGRTMKEYEDQLGSLKKENFNLKLRIYFLEERMGITSADEDAIKKNIELKVEVESLRKELIEKQDLLSQAAKAFELIEEQKEASSRDQAQYQQSLDIERRRIAQLEKELEEYREKMGENSVYYKEAFNIPPDKSQENKEQLEQMEKLVAALAAEVKQITASLEEERNWGLELEGERDQLRERLESEVELRQNLTKEKDKDIEQLRERTRQLEEQVFKLESSLQVQKREVAEKERVIKEKISLIEDKYRAYEELSIVCEKRKKQVDSLRASVKARDDALTELNNKHRTLLVQFEDNHSNPKSFSAPNSPSALNSLDDLHAVTMGQKSCRVHPLGKLGGSPLDWEPKRQNSLRHDLRLQTNISWDGKDLAKELEERDRELKIQEEAKKQLTLKLCNVQKSAASTDQRLRKLEEEKEKAVKMIQGFMERQEELEDKNLRKDRKIMELEVELSRLREPDVAKPNRRCLPVRRNLSNEISDNPERDQCNQQRFEEMESKINDLRDQIETIKAEKNELEMQIRLESEELQEQLRRREEKITRLESEKDEMRSELSERSLELDSLKERVGKLNRASECRCENNLTAELASKNAELEEKDHRIDQLSKELQIRTQNLQKLVNTELWSKNKEIAKLHNHMTASHQGHERNRNKSEGSNDPSATQLGAVVKELGEIGIEVKIVDDVVHLNCMENGNLVDAKSIRGYIQRLATQKSELEKEVDYLKWLKLVSRPTGEEPETSGSDTERSRKYCELLREHLKELVKFMKEMLKKTDVSDVVGREHRKIVLDIFLESQILPDEFFSRALRDVPESTCRDVTSACLEDRGAMDRSVKKSRSDAHLEGKNHTSTQSESEAFSEPDRKVSFARIGLRNPQQKSTNKHRFSKYTKTFSDSEDSIDYVPCHKTYQNDLNDLDTSNDIRELKETNSLLYTELNELRSELSRNTLFDDRFEEKLAPLLEKLDKSERFCEKLQVSLEKKMQECHTLKRESKQNTLRKGHLEKKMIEVENMAAELTKQKAELLQSKESAERKAAEMLTALNRENDMMRAKIKKTEDEMDAARKNLASVTRDLDELTLAHSQILVENTKLSNEKLKLEQELRKADSKYDSSLRSLHEKFGKEVADLNQVNDAHRARIHELESINKELRRQVVACETSDSAPSSSGVSSIPTDILSKQTCDDVMQEYHSYNGSQYWLPINYPTFTGRSKSSCSPDLGIESDAALPTARPLKDTLKITESMTNLLSEDENCNTNRQMRDLDSESPLPTEGLNEMEVLKQENEALKRRLMKTRRALEDTFQQLSASNKNKKNVEKAITKQLMITKTILKKTRTYEEPFEN